MAKLNLKQLSASSDLERVIEPLASYICAADQPRAALAHFGIDVAAFAESH